MEGATQRGIDMVSSGRVRANAGERRDAASAQGAGRAMRPVLLAMIAGTAGGAWVSREMAAPGPDGGHPRAATEAQEPSAPATQPAGEGEYAPRAFIPDAVLRVAARRAGRAGDLKDWPSGGGVHDIELAARLLAKLKGVPRAATELAAEADLTAKRREEQIEKVWDVVVRRMMKDW